MRPSESPKRLDELAAFLAIQIPVSDTELAGITHDSRRILPGDLYVALPGANTHGARFISQAIELGAHAVLTDPEGAQIAQGEVAQAVPLLVVDSVRQQLGPVSSWIYGDPSAHLKIIGITGTNGKTTTAMLTQSALSECGLETGLVGTIVNRFGAITFDGSRTTPEAPDLQAMLAVMREQGAQAVVMEVSSHAVALERVAGVKFEVVAFTNLSHDHLDFHGDMESYFQAKAKLFTSAYSNFGLICTDDEWGERLARETQIPNQTFGLAATSAQADWQASNIRRAAGGSGFHIEGPAISADAGCRLPGDFNIANALCAIVIAQHLQRGLDCAIRGVAASDGIPGRMQLVPVPNPDDDIAVFVDYAHTPEAVERAIAVGRGLAIERNSRVLVVLGCGGDRDAHKRPEMGAVAAESANVVVVTDDNPRSEDPAAIRAAVMAGATPVAEQSGVELVEIADRREALRWVVANAANNDVVLALGKGHETTQEIAGQFYHFDDAAELLKALSEERQ